MTKKNKCVLQTLFTKINISLAAGPRLLSGGISESILFSRFTEDRWPLEIPNGVIGGLDLDSRAVFCNAAGATVLGREGDKLGAHCFRLNLSMLRAATIIMETVGRTLPAFFYCNFRFATDPQFGCVGLQTQGHFVPFTVTPLGAAFHHPWHRRGGRRDPSTERP